ncbi:MAG: signal peptidase II [Verrucomicrobia subdivision 3 bacterium]|nr:signal peptidase II [Limisphaerales bacterium]
METPTADRQSTGGSVPFIEEKRILITAAIVLAADQISKQLVIRALGTGETKEVIEGFFRFVNWQNTGAAWSMFEGSSLPLAALSAVALIALIKFRYHFETHTSTGKLAFGLLIGGILGNLIDRVAYQHVIDFIRFYIIRSDGTPLGYPAFNIADMGICVGVGLLFLLAWREGTPDEEEKEETAKES